MVNSVLEGGANKGKTYVSPALSITPIKLSANILSEIEGDFDSYGETVVVWDN